MQTAIGAYDNDTRSVPATFTLGEIVHKRAVNACHTEGGAYDEEATAARVVEVAAGVAAKIAVGAITNPPAEAEEESEAE